MTLIKLPFLHSIQRSCPSSGRWTNRMQRARSRFQFKVVV